MSSIRTITSVVNEIGFAGRNLTSINDLTDDQIYGLFELAKLFEPFNRGKIDLFPTSLMATVFYQPSTRTRFSHETAMQRLGGMVVSEPAAMVSSSAAKEESLVDGIRCISQYANIIVLRHPDDS
jgi:aspartate carbamoyltransferase catalytic subunit